MSLSDNFAVKPLIVRHYQTHERYQRGLAVLDLALSKLGVDYRLMAPPQINMNEARAERLVISGALDVQFMSTTAEREAAMIPIRIPVYQGILGLRFLLVKRERQAEFSQISSLADLQRHSGGHGSDWGDLGVYAANQLAVVTNPNYDALFRQLIAGRFDYFHRGLNEVWEEWQRYENELVIADNVMLFYPHPVYIFVTKKRPELAQQIETGLTRAIQDGSARELFMAQHSAIIERLQIEKRHLIVLANPAVPADAPPLDTSWWLPEKFRHQLATAPTIR